MDRHYLVMTENYNYNNHNHTGEGYVPSGRGPVTSGNGDGSGIPNVLNGFDGSPSPPRMKTADSSSARPMAMSASTGVSSSVTGGEDSLVHLHHSILHGDLEGEPPQNAIIPPQPVPSIYYTSGSGTSTNASNTTNTYTPQSGGFQYERSHYFNTSGVSGQTGYNEYPMRSTSDTHIHPEASPTHKGVDHLEPYTSVSTYQSGYGFPTGYDTSANYSHTTNPAQSPNMNMNINMNPNNINMALNQSHSLNENQPQSQINQNLSQTLLATSYASSTLAPTSGPSTYTTSPYSVSSRTGPGFVSGSNQTDLYNTKDQYGLGVGIAVKTEPVSPSFGRKNSAVSPSNTNEQIKSPGTSPQNAQFRRNKRLTKPSVSVDKSDKDADLIRAIPPLHVQQQIANNNPELLNEAPEASTGSSNQLYLSNCSRCKKPFVQVVVMPNLSERSAKFGEPKIFKLCDHCRDLQRERSRRWQRKTKDRQGACRRCGTHIPADQQNFVLCPTCRRSLRDKKAVRAAQGRCIHCSGPLEAPILATGGKEDTIDTANVPPGGAGSATNNGTRRSISSRMNYKVCVRCRENDRIRRTNLEMLGNCNRCAKAMDVDEIGKHKVCHSCRVRKRKMLGSNSTDESRSTDPSPRVSILSGHDVSGDGNKSPLQHNLQQPHNLDQQQLLQTLQPQLPQQQQLQQQPGQLFYWSEGPLGIFVNQYQMQGYEQQLQLSQQQAPQRYSGGVYEASASGAYLSYGNRSGANANGSGYAGYEASGSAYAPQYPGQDQTQTQTHNAQSQYQGGAWYGQGVPPLGEGSSTGSDATGKSQYFINPFSDQQLRNRGIANQQHYPSQTQTQTQTYMASPMEYQQQPQATSSYYSTGNQTLPAKEFSETGQESGQK